VRISSNSSKIFPHSREAAQLIVFLNNRGPLALIAAGRDLPIIGLQ
jgi:hypothetical protein